MKKKLLYFMLLVFSSIFFAWNGIIYWTTGEVYLSPFGDKIKLDITEENTNCIFKDIEVLENGNMLSLSNDSYVSVDLPKNTDISYLIFDIDIKNNTNSTFFQVFYSDSLEGFSQNNSINETISSGINIIEIKQGEYDRIRLDFTSEEGLEFSIDSVEVCEKYIPFSAILSFGILSFLLIAIIYICVFKPEIISKIYIIFKWNNLSVRSKALFMLFIFSTVTMGIVFLKIYYSDLVYVYSERDIGSDTIIKYLPQYNLIVDKIRNGSLSMWLPEAGYGYSIYYFSMFNPLLIFVLLLCAIFGTSYIPMILVVYKLIVVLLCGYIAFRYLELFTDNYYVISIGAYIYAFNGFTIVWGQHYVLSDYPIFAILVFYFIEKYLRAKNRKIDITIILVSFFSMVFSAYMSYMIYLPAAVYAIVRYIQLNDKITIKNFVLSILNLGLNVIIGFVGGLCIGLMHISNILNSGRVTDTDVSKLDMFTENIGRSYLQDDFLGSLQRFLSANLSGIAGWHKGLANYYEEPQLFLTALFWMIFLQFIFTIHRTSVSKKQIVCKWIAVVLVGLSLFNKGFLAILYALSKETRRTSFVFLPILVVMIVLVLDNILRKHIISKLAIILGTVVSTILLLYNYGFLVTTEKKIVIAVSFVAIIVFAIVSTILCLQKKILDKKSCIILVMLVIFSSVTVELYVSTYRNNLLTKQLFKEKEIKEKVAQEVIDYVRGKDDLYYRMDKTYTVWNNQTDSFYLGYYPVTTYNSGMASHTKEYNEKFMNPMYTSITQFKPSYKSSPYDIIQYSSLGLKYILSDYPLGNYEYLEEVDKVNDIYIYKNIYAETFTTFFDNVVLKSEFEKLGYNDRVKIQQMAMVIEDVAAENFKDSIVVAKDLLNEYEYVDLTEKVLVNKDDKYIDITFDNDWYTYVEGTPAIELRVFVEEKQFVNINLDTGNGYNDIEMYRMSCIEGENEIQYVLPTDVKSVRVNLGNNANAKIVDFKLIDSKEAIKVLDNPSLLREGKSNSQIIGTISCDRDGVLYLPLVYSENWEVKIDGKKVETFVANAGFLGINILEGDHEIEIAYVSKEIRIGLICLIFAIVATSIYYVLCTMYEKKNVSKSN
ncbi:MAG: hypothetical protein E7270_00250 [Lachnospiraceae bacterium]|nr:hypothetical protein [Lachnospiraceae bacterium]